MPGGLNFPIQTQGICIPGLGFPCKVPASSQANEPKFQPKPSPSPPASHSSYRASTPLWKRYLRGGLTILGGIAAYDVYYNAIRGRGLIDWFRGFNRQNYENFGFDNNHLPVNGVGHGLGGAGYDLACLVIGDLDELESAACTVGGAGVFEAVAEEKQPSANDLAFTPLAGTAIGGALHLFGGQLRRMDFDFNLSKNFLGVQADERHRFDLAVGAETLQPHAPESQGSHQFQAQFSAEMNAIAQHGEEGAREGWVIGKRAELSASVTVDDHGLSALQAGAQTALIGHSWEDFAKTPGGTKEGQEFYLGLGTVYDYDQRSARPEFPEDHLIDAGIAATADYGGRLADGFSYRLRGDLIEDFAMSTPLAYSAWSSNHSTEGVKPILDEGYYYAIGPMGRILLSGKYRDYELGLQAEYQHLDSVDGFSRNQAEVTNDIHLVDLRRKARIWASRTYGNFLILAELIEEGRHGQVAGSSAESGGTRFGVKLGLTF